MSAPRCYHCAEFTRATLFRRSVAEAGRGLPAIEAGMPLPAGTGAGAIEASPVGAELRDRAETMGAPQCGPAAGNPFLPWFREAGEHIRSVALVPLGQTRTIGLLALGSEDPQRFFPEMGTLYLRRIGEITAGALAART